MTTTEQQSIAERLRGHATLGKAPLAELEWLAARGYLRRFAAGDVVVRQGEAPASGLFVLLTGHVVLYANRGRGRSKIAEWRAKIGEWRQAYGLDHDMLAKAEPSDIILPQQAVQALYQLTEGHAYVTSDVGQHQMWVAQRYPFQRPNTHITSGGLGAMGFAVPAAMGVHLARPGEPVWAISGDGGFQMNMAEIATMVQEGLAVKLAIFNNGYLGMVRQWQQFFHGGRYSNTPIWSPDYVKLAEAYGIPGYRVRDAGELADAVGRATADPGPALVEFVIEQEANVYPMIPPGGSLSEPIEATV